MSDQTKHVALYQLLQWTLENQMILRNLEESMWQFRSRYKGTTRYLMLMQGEYQAEMNMFESDCPLMRTEIKPTSLHFYGCTLGPAFLTFFSRSGRPWLHYGDVSCPISNRQLYNLMADLEEALEHENASWASQVAVFQDWQKAVYSSLE